MMNKIPNGSNVIGLFLGKGKGLAHQSGYTLPEGAVKTFQVVGFATVFLNRTMLVRWNNSGISFPFIGVTDGSILIGWGQGIPESLRGSVTTVSNHQSDHFPTIGIQRNPDPLFIRLTAHKGAHFVTLQD